MYYEMMTMIQRVRENNPEKRSTSEYIGDVTTLLFMILGPFIQEGICRGANNTFQRARLSCIVDEIYKLFGLEPKQETIWTKERSTIERIVRKEGHAFGLRCWAADNLQHTWVTNLPWHAMFFSLHFFVCANAPQTQ